MKAILSYRPSCIDLVDWVDGEEILRKDSWLMSLANRYGIGSLKLCPRDELKRIVIEMSVDDFIKLKEDHLFIMKCEDLRRLQTTRRSVIEYLVTSYVNTIDNDLDKK